MVAAVMTYTIDDLGFARTCRQIRGSRVALQEHAGLLVTARHLLVRRDPALFTILSLGLGSFLCREETLPGLTHQRMVLPGQAFFISDDICPDQ